MNPYLQVLLQSNPLTGVATGLSQLGKAAGVLEKTPFTQAYRHARRRGEEAMAQGNPYLGGFAQGYSHGWQAPMNQDYLSADEAPGGAAVEMLEPVQWTVGALSGGLGKAGQLAVPGARALTGSVGRMAAKPFQQHARRQAMRETAPELLGALQGQAVGRSGGEFAAEYGGQQAVSTARPRWLPKRDVYEVLPYDPEQGMYPILADTEDDLRKLAFNLRGEEAQEGLRGFSHSNMKGPSGWQYDVAATHEGALPGNTMTHEVAGHIPEHRMRGFGSDAMVQQARQQYGGLADDMYALNDVFASAGATLPEQYAGRTPVQRGREFLARYRAGQFPEIGQIPWVENAPWFRGYHQAGEKLMDPMRQAIANRVQDRHTRQLANQTARAIGKTQGDDAFREW